MSAASRAALERDMRDERMKECAGEMFKALKAGHNALREEIREGGGCDHSVGICWCHIIRVADQMEEVIAKVERT